MRTVLLLSGSIASGKSAIANELVAKHHFHSVGTGKHLTGLLAKTGVQITRSALQNFGDQLDIQTDYQWPVEVASASMLINPSVNRWLLDSVRKKRQVENFRNFFGNYVLHVHLNAPDSVLKRRYEERLLLAGSYVRATSYLQAIKHENETAARSLSDIADLTFDTNEMTSLQIAINIVQFPN